jgi:putative CocE/NonD family hydrolase
MMTRREWLAILAACAVAPGDALNAARAAGSPPKWSLPDKRQFKIIENTWVPMKDGIRLAARIWLPEGADKQPVPVVWEYLPYRLWDDLRWRDDKSGANLAPYGVAFVRVDIRGTGNSEGVMVDEYDVPELTDGVEVIAWLAKQTWSNGSVGMRGISWGGINALQVAALNPPALKAIMPMGCIVNRFTQDAHYLGGAYGQENLGWGVSFKGHMAAPPDPAVVGPRWEALWRERLDATPPILETWSSHQRYDSYWRRGSPDVDYAAIKCPVYVVDGWGDPYSDCIGQLLEHLKVPRKGLIGPWGHIFPNLATPLGLDWPYEEVRWWRHWLSDVDTGLMQEPMLRAYVMYQADSQAFPEEVPGRWVAEATWPRPGAMVSTLYLDKEGSLARQPGSRAHVKYVGDKVVGITKPQWVYGRPTEFEQSADDRNSLIFDSPALIESVEVLGYPVAEFRVSADVPVAQLAVRLTEVMPDGKSWLVSYGLLNLTRRESMQTASPLTPGEFYDVEVPLYLCGHRFQKGSRIRAAISAGLWPLVWPSPSIATLTFELGVSKLLLPVRAVPKQEAPFDIPVIRPAAMAAGLGKAVGGYANGLQWVKTPVEAGSGAQMPVRNDQGRYKYNRSSIPQSTIVAAVGTTTTSSSTRNMEITEGQPNSGIMKLEESYRWQHDGWDCTIEFGGEMTSTADAFHLREWVIARKGGAELFRREKPSTIKRDLL